jgi:predicted nuclease of predicted toxin-antitoxin system
MKFLVDAQLPRRMVGWLTAAGSDVLHALDLPLGNRTPDEEVIETAEQDRRIVATKDADFVNLLSGRPAKLLFVATGNISNRELEQLVVPLIPRILAAFQTHSFLELGRSGIIVRG